MLKEEELLIRFCKLLSQIRRLFRKMHIKIEKLHQYSNVTTTVSHGEKYLILDEIQCPAIEISFSLDSDFAEKKDNKISKGVSISIYYVQDRWRIQADIGWSCQDTGWEEFKSFEKIVENYIQLEESSIDFVDNALTVYHNFINNGSFDLNLETEAK